MNAITSIARKVSEIEGLAPDAIPYDALIAAQQPVILRGVARRWPLVAKGQESAEAAIAYLEGFDAGKPVVAFTGAPEIGGRFFYNAEVTGFNFEGARAGLTDTLERMRPYLGEADAPSVYIGSTDLDIYLPEFRAENDLALNDPMFAAYPPLASIWIGNRTTATAHYDMSHNLAVCTVGRRRFTLFPPEQVANLYPGPLEPTPGGQVVSMVDFREPDFAAYPRFRDAIAAAQVAELEAGDVLFYPALWWHHVEALDTFNVLVNYWWNTQETASPFGALVHALMSLRALPEPEKAAWKALFDYYIFGPAGQAAGHLPEHARGPLGQLDEIAARRLRAQLLNRLNR